MGLMTVMLALAFGAEVNPAMVFAVTAILAMVCRAEAQTRPVCSVKARISLPYWAGVPIGMGWLVQPALGPTTDILLASMADVLESSTRIVRLAYGAKATLLKADSERAGEYTADAMAPGMVCTAMASPDLAYTEQAT